MSTMAAVQSDMTAGSSEDEAAGSLVTTAAEYSSAEEDSDKVSLPLRFLPHPLRNERKLWNQNGKERRGEHFQRGAFF